MLPTSHGHGVTNIASHDAEQRYITGLIEFLLQLAHARVLDLLAVFLQDSKLCGHLRPWMQRWRLHIQPPRINSEDMVRCSLACINQHHQAELNVGQSFWPTLGPNRPTKINAACPPMHAQPRQA